MHKLPTGSDDNLHVWTTKSLLLNELYPWGDARPGSVREQHKGVLCAKKGIGLDGKSPKRTIWQHKLST